VEPRPAANVQGAAPPPRPDRVLLTPIVLLITGAPASGKTTVGRRLARELGLAYLSKDLFKEVLFDELGWQDRAWSKKVGGASMRLLYACADELLRVGQSVALESNFYSRWDTEPLQALIQRHASRVVQVLCVAPGPVLAERYKQRAFSGERHPGHVDRTSMDEILPILLGDAWPELPLDGPVVRVDTTDFEAIDYPEVLRRCKQGQHQGSGSVIRVRGQGQGLGSGVRDQVPEEAESEASDQAPEVGEGSEVRDQVPEEGRGAQATDQVPNSRQAAKS
jgi:predicted kinase